MSILLDRLDRERAAFAPDERNDCVVRATAIVARASYRDAHNLWRTLGGRRRYRGVHFMSYADKIFETLNRQLVPVDLAAIVSRKGSGLTPRTVGKWLPRGRFVCKKRGHVFALVNGKVIDWTAGRCHRITHIWKVV